MIERATIDKVLAQSKGLDDQLEKLLVRLATNDVVRDEDEEDALIALAITLVRQMLDEHRLLIRLMVDYMDRPAFVVGHA